MLDVAMESTGSYWQTLFDALQNAGFEVTLVNGNQIKNVKGKKTDVLDCMWIQKLHSLGLLSASFLPNSDLQKLRTYYSHRQYLVAQTSKYINKMQKAMRLMNIRLDVALNDIMGKSGRDIVQAILSGERDPGRLSLLANYRVKKSKEEIAKSLEGNWREDLLYELKECLKVGASLRNVMASARLVPLHVASLFDLHNLALKKPECMSRKYKIRDQGRIIFCDLHSYKLVGCLYPKSVPGYFS